MLIKAKKSCSNKPFETQVVCLGECYNGVDSRLTDEQIEPLLPLRKAVGVLPFMKHFYATSYLNFF